MRKFLLFVLFFTVLKATHSQKVDSIYFHLYTDSLKKGFYNYINVDGKTSDDQWIPMTDKEVKFTANTGRFEGNSLFIDSSYTGETVKIKAELKSNPAISKEVTIYIRKRGFTEPLKTNEEIFEEMRKEKVKTKTKN
ncbi:MAG: hypothetical protein ACM3VS_12035 [Candidatus Dadabacteria bacterium]